MGDCFYGCLDYPAPGPRPPTLIPSPRPPAPQKFLTSSTFFYLKSSHYDHRLWVYGLFKPTHATCICFKETPLLFTVHLSCFVNFIMCLTDKYMFKVSKLVLGNCGSSTYCENEYSEKAIYILRLMSCSLSKILHIVHM